MSQIDQRYLRDKQSNLNDRITLHRLFGTNSQNWYQWVFSQFLFLRNARVLEIGCGTGDLWLENIDQIPKDWYVLLTDFSKGMIDQIRERLFDKGQQFTVDIADVQHLPFDDGEFDVVVANHMMYHVPDRVKAVSEIRRVLKSGGRLFCATNNHGHMQELIDLVESINPGAYRDTRQEQQFGFREGWVELRSQFEEVELLRYSDDLIVTDVEALVAYVCSADRLNDEQMGEFRTRVEKEITAHKVFFISKNSGMFVCQK